jgi:hypothetical protein
MNEGQIISGAGHATLILWVLVGGFFSTPDDAPAVAVTSVSLVSSAEFDAMVAAAPSTPDAAKPEVTPEIAAPEPVAVETEPVTAPAASPKPKPAPKPEPEPEPVPETNPDVAEIASVAEPDLVEAPEPLAPVAETEQPVVVPETTEEAKPQDAPRVAPVPAEAPSPDAEVAEVPTPAVSPDAAPDAPVAEEEKPEAAPEAATTEIVTEATETTDTPSLAPTSSQRPRTKPPARTAEPVSEEPAVEDVASAETATPTEDSIADAVAAAVSETEATDGAAAPSGPPLTAGEKDALRVAVQACWNVGSLSTDALRTTVTVGVNVAQSGVPDAASITMLGFEGGSEASALQAYEAARRAIIRCGATGFKLPADKYDQWKEIEMVFNPERMRIK